jgi:hypothetical protein
MKQIYLVLASFSVLQGFAQLTGTVTIDDGLPASAANYTSFSSLATTLSVGGINGPLVVFVNPGSGPYTEQVLFTQVPGASPFNNITINGNGCTLTYSAGMLPYYTLRLDGADFFRFDNLVIEAQTTKGNGCEVTNAADRNYFSNCTFLCPTTGSATTGAGVKFTQVVTNGLSGGNNNSFRYCKFSGGYIGAWVSGNNKFTLVHGNSFDNCTFIDYEYAAMLSTYSRNLSVLFCTAQRPNRAVTAAAVGFWFTENAGLLCEGNTVSDLYTATPTSTINGYGIFCSYNTLPAGLATNIIRSNIVSCIASNAAFYGIFAMNLQGLIIHNTIDLNDQVASNAITYGLYVYNGTGDSVRVRNNLVSVNRSGTGLKYTVHYDCGYGLLADNNALYMGSTAGTNHLAYYCGPKDLSQLQTQMQADPHSFDVVPMLAPLGSCRPYPTNTVIVDGAAPLGVLLDANQSARSMTTPDFGALESAGPPCAGTPTNSIVGPLSICAGAHFSLLTGLTNNFSGLNLKWESGPTSTGPFTAIPNAKSVQLNVPGIFSNTWFRAILTCTLPGGGFSTSVHSVQVAGPHTDTVPYFEHFENLAHNDALPNCSWLATDLANANLTFTAPAGPGRFPKAGNGFASFFNVAGNQNAFFTNGILMKPGITYSAATFYNRDNSTNSNYSKLELFYSAQQSLSSGTPINSVTPAFSGTYQLIDGLFTVPSTAMYHVAVAATSNFSTASFLLLDDLSVTIPCKGNGSATNSVNLEVIAPTATITQGQSATINASGADQYSWSTGAVTSSITVTPASTSVYTVTGTNTLTGCASTKTVLITFVNTVSLNEMTGSKMRVYPNPCTNELTSLFPESNCERSIKVVDVLGKVHIRQISKKPEVTLDVSSLAPGVYFLVEKSELLTQTTRFIKE